MRFPALQSRDFVIYTAGNVSAMNALWINRVVIGWLGWELTGLASWVGFLSFLLFAPTFISSPLFGVILDRVDLRRAAIVSQSVVIAAVTALLLFYVTGLLTIWLLGLVALVIGVTSSADRTIRFVLVPLVVDKAALANAVAIHGINFNTARLIGPAIGGFLIAGIGTDVTILVNIVMILPFLAVLFVIRLRDREKPKADRQPFFREMLDGARYAAGHPVIRQAMLISALYSITIRGILEILPAIADGEFHRGASGLGQMLAASGAGALVAAVLIALRRPGASERGITPAAYISIATGIVGAAALGATDNWLVAMAAVFVLGFSATANGIDLQTSVQLALSDVYRSRVMSLWIVLVIGGAAMNSIALGFLADLFGMPGTLIGAGIACALLSGFAIFGPMLRGATPTLP
jgi:MFS family permease